MWILFKKVKGFPLLHMNILPFSVPLTAITDGETDMSGLLLVK